jgi:pyruvate/2-oxoglutarate dehydrogenase complex dihydrolipoamide dehydrogenase (E3) component
MASKADEFDIAILGGGAGAKLIWGAVGQRSVAVVEQSWVGGACPFMACVPSKAMLRTARVWQLGAAPHQSALFPGRVPAAEPYRLTCDRRGCRAHRSLSAARRYRPDHCWHQMRTAAVRSETDGEPAGWITLLADPATQCVIGATGMGRNAEEWITVLSQAIRAATLVALLAEVVHPFPSFGELLENPLWELRESLHARPTTTSAAPK